jgi:SAM-dependent methyltransferase
MNNRDRLARRLMFREAAAAYDAVRPGYPPRLVDLLIARAGLDSASRVLEIGCGTGQLTRDLAPTGCHIVCLEPGGELAQFARRNLSRFPNVQVREETFESFEVAPGTFGLVVAATSFHWLDPEARCAKACQVLRSGGMLGLLTNAHPSPWSGFFVRVQDLYRAIAPELARSGTSSETEKWAEELIHELAQSERFEHLETSSERWERRYSRDQYLALLHTFSPHRRIPEDQRRRLFTAIGRLIDEEFSGFVDQPYVTALCLARKAP